MALLRFISHDTNIDFVGRRIITFAIVIITIVVFAASLMWKGLNYGVDFKGGISMEIHTKTAMNLNHVRSQLSDLKLGEVSVQEFGSPLNLLLKMEAPKESQKPLEAVQASLTKVKSVFGSTADYRKIETIGPKVGGELARNGLKAVVLALLGILVYIAVRFEWRFAVCAILALAHDCFLVLGLFSLFPLEFNETAITAILITASYSINDTIVVFDRIRENIRRFRKRSLAEIINKSINETLSRTVLTVVTTMLSVLALYCFGGAIISVFVLPILVSLILGTLSSIFVAAPLLLYFNVKFGPALDAEEERPCTNA
jgi:preprotein translocase subunit SecF